jgi:hypothetical protein
MFSGISRTDPKSVWYACVGDIVDIIYLLQMQFGKYGMGDIADEIYLLQMQFGKYGKQISWLVVITDYS